MGNFINNPIIPFAQTIGILTSSQFFGLHRPWIVGQTFNGSCKGWNNGGVNSFPIFGSRSCVENAMQDLFLQTAVNFVHGNQSFMPMTVNKFHIPNVFNHFNHSCIIFKIEKHRFAMPLSIHNILSFNRRHVSPRQENLEKAWICPDFADPQFLYQSSLFPFVTFY